MESVETPKKGKRSWQPRSSRLKVENPEPGVRYKWFTVAGGDSRIDEAREEGWEVVSGVTGGRVRAGDASSDSLRRVGTLRLMKLPEDLAESRDEYHKRETDRQTMRPAQRAMQMLGETGGPYDPREVISEPVTKATRYPTRGRTAPRSR